MSLTTRLLIYAALALAPVAPVHAAPPLRIVQFDFEGGGGTLFITPDKRTLLVDAGWPAGMGSAEFGSPSNAQRIAAELKRRGIARIDYVMITHYHLDHVGGLAELATLVPVGTFVDHGDNREPLPANPAQHPRAAGTLYAQYLQAIAGKRRRIVKPGDRLRIGGLTVDITNADGEVLRPPLGDGGRGGGGAGVGCPGVGMERVGGEENVRSIGFVARYGRARVVLLGDTTRNIEQRLVCPRNLIGRVDLMLATQHGSAASNGAVVYANLRPRVVIIGNGETKGGDPATYDAITAAPGLQGLWQVHEAVKTGAKNAPAEHIANLAGTPDANHAMLIDVERDGAMTVTNARTSVSQNYPIFRIAE